MVILSHLSLTLEDLDEDTGLIVGIGGEDLRFLGRNGSTSGDQGSHDSTSSLDTQTKGSSIKDDNILDFLVLHSGEDGGLDGSTIGHSLIRIDTLVGFLSIEELLNHVLDLGDTGRTTNQDDFVNHGLRETGILENLLQGGNTLLEDGHTEFLELGSSDDGVEVVTLGEGINLDGGLTGRGENSLSLLTLGSKSSHGSGIISNINSGLILELLATIVHQFVIKIFTTQMGITSRSLNLEDTLINGEEGHIESTTTQIKDDDILFLLLVLLIKTVGYGGSCGFIDNS